MNIYISFINNFLKSIMKVKVESSIFFIKLVIELFFNRSWRWRGLRRMVFNIVVRIINWYRYV